MAARLAAFYIKGTRKKGAQMSKPAKRARRQPEAKNQAPAVRKSQPDRVAGALVQVEASDARFHNVLRQMYEDADKLVVEIGPHNVARLEQVMTARAQRTVDEMKAWWRAKTRKAGGVVVPLPPQLTDALRSYVEDVRTHIKPLSDFAKLELSTKRAGLPTPSETKKELRGFKPPTAGDLKQRNDEMLKDYNERLNRGQKPKFAVREIRESKKYKDLRTGKPLESKQIRRCIDETEERRQEQKRAAK